MELTVNERIANNVEVMQKVRLKHIVKISKGKKSIEVNSSNLRYIQIGDLRNDNNLKYAEHSKSNVLCTKNDVLIAWDGANAGTIGYNLEGAVGSTLAKLVINDNYKIFPNFLGRFLQTKSKSLRDNCSGATIPHISKSELENIEIPLPSLLTQQKIAEILDTADQLRQYNKQLIEKYDALTQSLFLEMFGDPVRNKKGWEVTSIRELCSEVKYGTSEKSIENGTFSYLRMNNITYGGYMDFSNLKYIDIPEKDLHKYLVKKGDILFNRTNSKELVGKTGLITTDQEYIIAGYLIRVRTNELANPYYIWAHLNSKWSKMTLNNMCKNIVGMANINAQELQDIQILKAPILLQNQFAERVQIIETQKQQAQEALAKSENLFQGLLQRAFKEELV